MKAEAAPRVPGKTPWKKLDNAVRMAFDVTKDDLVEREDRAKRARKKAKRKK